MDEAAHTLGLSVDAIRKRIQRGTIEHEKDSAGRVRVLLDSPDNTSTLQDESPETTGHVPDALLAAKDETISELRGRVESLERQLDAHQEENRRKDHLLAAALELAKRPAIEAPEPREWPASTESAHYGTSPQEAQESLQRRSWWRRWFGFE